MKKRHAKRNQRELLPLTAKPLSNKAYMRMLNRIYRMLRNQEYAGRTYLSQMAVEQVYRKYTSREKRHLGSGRYPRV